MSVLLKKNFPGSIRSVGEEISARLKKGEADSFMYVVPTKRKLRDIQREFFRQVPNQTAPEFFLFTLETLSVQLHRMLCPPKRIVSSPAQAVLMRQAIDGVADELRYFHFRGVNRQLPKGTFERIVNVINTLKSHGVYPAVLYAEIESAEEDDRARLQDFLRIYEEYERRLGASFIDGAGILKELNERWDGNLVSGAFRRVFPEVATVFVSGFDEFSDPELTMLHHVSELQACGMVVEFDFYLQNDELFGHLRQNYDKFLQLGFVRGDPREGEQHSLRQHIAQVLFQPGILSSKITLNDRVSLFDAASREEETEMIAKIIKHLVHENPERDLGKICVALYQPQAYTQLIRETFGRYGVPANITDRFSLDQSPLVVSLLAMLDIERNDFRLRDILRAVSSSYFRFRTLPNNMDPGNLYEVAVRLKLTGGYSVWIERIDERLKCLSARLESMENDEEERNLHREERELRQAKDDLSYLARLLKRFSGALTPYEFKDRLVKLMDELRVTECLVDSRFMKAGPERVEKDTRAFQKFLSFLDDFLSILRLQSMGDVHEPLGFYVEQLRAALFQIRYNVRQRYGYGVLVTSFEETRGLEFDFMIIAGLVDGEFPPVYQPEIFLDAARRRRKERYHLTEHRYLFYQAMSNFKEHLYLTYPRKDGELELVSSSFLDSLQKIAVVNDQCGALPEEVSEALFSKDEFLMRLGTSFAQESDVQDEQELDGLDEELRHAVEQMRHSVAVEKSRTVTKSMPEYEGNIFESLDAESRKLLGGYRNKEFSVTQLESYARCPFQYFADRILGLIVPAELEDGLTPIERGGIIHDILFEFFVNRRERGSTSICLLSETEFNEALDGLRSIARRKFDDIPISGAFWDLDKESVLGTSVRKGTLREFLEHERDRKVETKPAFFEVSFGSAIGPRRRTDPHLAYGQPIMAGDVKLRGKIDRVDLGENDFTVIDYKTGSSAALLKEINLGIGLQLPVYLHAVAQILREKLGSRYEGVAGIYYAMKSPVREQVGVGSAEHMGKSFPRIRSKQLVKNDIELHAIISQAIGRVQEYVDAICRGQFPVEPKIPDQTCRNCDFQTVCRIQSQLIIHDSLES